MGTTSFADKTLVDDFSLSVSEVAGIRTSVTSDETSEYTAVYNSAQNTMALKTSSSDQHFQHSYHQMWQMF